jgi:hypothetical protein
MKKNDLYIAIAIIVVTTPISQTVSRKRLLIKPCIDANTKLQL